MCLLIKKKQVHNKVKSQSRTVNEMLEEEYRKDRAVEKYLEWVDEQFANGEGQKLLDLQAAIESDVEKIFGKYQR